MSVKLLPREWISVLGLAALLFLLSLASSIGQSYPEPLSRPAQVASSVTEECVVKIEGAVGKPGVYRLPKGTSLQELFDKVGLAPNADIRRYKVSRLIQRSQNINIRTLPMIRIFVSGAVKNIGALRVPKGTRLCDLRNYCEFASTADLGPLERKRRLKDGEQIRILDREASL